MVDAPRFIATRSGMELDDLPLTVQKADVLARRLCRLKMPFETLAEKGSVEVSSSLACRSLA